MTYREKAIETVKLACQDLIDRTEELIPNTEGITDIEIIIDIPTKTDLADSIPTLTVMTNAYPRRSTVEKIIDVFEGGTATR